MKSLKDGTLVGTAKELATFYRLMHTKPQALKHRQHKPNFQYSKVHDDFIIERRTEGTTWASITVMFNKHFNCSQNPGTMRMHGVAILPPELIRRKNERK